MKLFTTGLLILLSAITGYSQAKVHKLLFIGIDGCRAEALLAANTPAIDNLIAHSVYSTEGLCAYKTWSGNGWSSMLTGVWHPKHGVTDNTFSGSNYTNYPDFIKRMETFNPNFRTVTAVHWAPINNTIINNADKENTYGTDLEVKNGAVNALTNDNPDVLFVDFDDVDHAGHTWGFTPSTFPYIQAIETTDGYVGNILTAMQSRANYANEDWLVIVTTDHGGNLTGHGGGTVEERTIFTVYSNPGFTPQQLSRHVISGTANYNEAHLLLHTYGRPVNQTPFLFGATQDFTIEFWVKPSAFTGDPSFISNKNWNSGSNAGFVISAQQSQFWKVNIGDGSDRLDIQGGLLSPNVWHHLAVSFDRDGLMTAYEDGAAVGFEKMQNIGSINSGLPLIINQDGTTTYGLNLDGSYRDIRIWNTVIPDSTLMNWATKTVNSTHPYYNRLLANWKCSDGSGSVLQDASPNNNSCNLTGPLIWNNNQTNTFSIFDYSETTREPDNAVMALTWMCVPIQTSWNLDGKVRGLNCGVSISANPPGPICPGTSVKFTATPVNGGTAPAYQWLKNGLNVATGSTYISTSLINGDVISCVLTSNAYCVPLTASSNSITMSVNSSVIPGISISANPGVVICAGRSVTFTATATDGGSSPAYQWKKNGSNVGTGSTYTSSSLANGNVITCVLTSNAGCVSTTTATSNALTITVNPLPVPQITPSPANICSGGSVVLSTTMSFSSYLWTSGATTASITVTATGSYGLTVSNSSGCSAGTSTNVTSVSKCNIPANFTTSALTDSSATLNWTGVSCAYIYTIQYRKSGTSAWTNITINPPAVSKVLTGLSPSTSYQWKIKTQCFSASGKQSSWSTTQSFTTLPSSFSRSTAINTINADAAKFSVYPNPASDNITVDLPQSIFDLLMVDESGKSVFEMKNVSEKLVINSVEFSRGIYFIRAATEKNIFTKVIVLK